MTLRPLPHLAGGCVLLLLASGCSAAIPGSTPVAVVSAATTAAVEPTPTATETSTPALPSSAAPSPTLGTVVTPTPTGTSSTPLVPGIISANAGSLIRLSTDNAFHANGWTLGTYLPAASTVPVEALAATVNCDADGQEMEYRFSPTYGTLRVAVAQDILSDSSDNTVNFQLVADGKVVAEKAIKFKQSGDLSMSLSGVTVVKLVASTKGACKTSSVALLTNATVQG